MPFLGSQDRYGVGSLLESRSRALIENTNDINNLPKRNYGRKLCVIVLLQVLSIEY